MPSQLFSPGTVVTSVWLNEADTSTHPQLSSLGGTANALTAAGPASLLSYVVGQTFRLVPVLGNTTTVTININGLGVKSITKYGSTALVAGDLLVGVVAEIVYDGTNFQLSNPRTVSTNVTGRLLGVQTFTSAGTYTPTTGTASIFVRLLGGGGGGGGGQATAAGSVSIGSGGGAGGYGETYITSGFSGTSITIGGGGVGVSGGTGVTGGTTSFGAFISATGGIGGVAGVSGAIVAVAGGLGGVASGGSVLNARGALGESAVASQNTGVIKGGAGASSSFGQGGAAALAVVAGANGGGNAAVYGSGGGGSAVGNSLPASTGGTGSPGFVIVYEYS